MKEKVWVVDKDTGDSGWLVNANNPEEIIEDPGRTAEPIAVKLDRGKNAITKPYRNGKWQIRTAAPKMSPPAKAMVAYAAIAAFGKARGDYALSKKEFSSFPDPVRIAFITNGPGAIEPLAAFDSRKKLFDAIMKALKDD